MHPLDSIFKPQSIAVVGASRRTGSIGRKLLHNLIEFDFHGKVFPVNPHADFIHSIKAFPSVSAIPDAVDLAVIVVPRDEVLAAVDDCGRKGVNGMVVITAGFSETGEQGRVTEGQLHERVRQYGMRMIGPNSMGIINTAPSVSIDATFAPTLPLPGRIAFMSQSGALGVAILNMASQLDIGFSYFVSMGNKTDVSANDLLLYWEDDLQTDMVLMYLESLGNARQFMQIARRLGKKKPLIAVKSGRTLAGARAALSHTGAIVSRQGLDAATDALLEQLGVIRVNSVEELFDLAKGFSKNPLPRGNRLGILSNAGGPAIMGTDTAIGLGLQMAVLSDTTRAGIKQLVPPEAAVQNPIDMTPLADRSKYEKCARLLLENDGVDMLLVIYVPPVLAGAMDIVMGLEELRKQYPKPVLAVMMAPEDFFDELNREHPGHMAIYRFPESAVRALHAMDRYRQWRERPAGEIRKFDVAVRAAEDILNEARRQGREHLSPGECFRLLECYGIPVARYALATGKDELMERAHDFRFPVALKVVAPGVLHKTEAGGVALDIRSIDELGFAAARIAEGVRRYGEVHPPSSSVEPTPLSFLLQEYVRGGRELIVGMTQDPNFGPLLMFGLGGVYVETLRDVVFRVPPLTELDALEMMRQIRGYHLLEGVRGEPPMDLQTIAEILQRFAQMVEELGGLAEIDINPLMAFPAGRDFCAVDARVRLQAASATLS